MLAALVRNAALVSHRAVAEGAEEEVATPWVGRLPAVAAVSGSSDSIDELVFFDVNFLPLFLRWEFVPFGAGDHLFVGIPSLFSRWLHATRIDKIETRFHLGSSVDGTERLEIFAGHHLAASPSLLGRRLAFEE
jgi:hypothetical protein